MDGWMDGRTDGRTDGLMDGWMDGWIEQTIQLADDLIQLNFAFNKLVSTQTVDVSQT
jgi:hypothetical protein